MRYRINNYTVEGLNIILPHEITIEDLRLLTNETQEMTLCSSMYKNKALVKKDGIWVEIPNAVTINGNIITISKEACTLSDSDMFTIEIDKGDSVYELLEQIEENTAELSNKIEGIQIDTTDLAKELTLAEVSSKLDNLNVDIDLSHISKQGTNTEATNTRILDKIEELSTTYDDIYAQQLANIIG